MAYKAYLNNTELFFDSSFQDGSFLLSYAVLKLQYGSAGQFAFRIPPENSHFDDFQRLKTFVDVYRDDDLIFSGRVYSISDQFNLEREVVCEGLLALLNDSIFRPRLFDGTLHELVSAIIASHNSQVKASKQITVGTITVSDAECYRDYQNYETSISRLKDLVDSFGGYLHIKKANGQLTLNWYQDMIDATSQKIELASNLIDIKQTVDSSGVITVLIPLGAETEDGTRLTVESVNGGKDYITASEADIDQYGYVVGSRVWNDVTTPAMLMYRGKQFLAASLTPRTTIKLTAVDLADAGYDVDSFLPGQKITVSSAPHGINNVQFLCQTQNLNLLQPARNVLTLGEVRIGFVQSTSKNSADVIVEQIAGKYATKTALEEKIDHATSLITGNEGGYVVMHDSDGDTYPDELLVMDTPDIDTAVKVWRFNNSGLGYSSTGYDGTYGLAMTMDGGIVADRINTGTLNGNLIRAGVIRGQQGDSYWDLNTGVLHIEGTGDIDKSKVFIYEPVPPYYVGDLWVTQRDDSSGVVGYMVAGYGVVGNTASGEGGKIMTCIYTRTSGDFDESDWSLITNYVSDNDLQILEQRVSAAELHIDANTATIMTKASTEVTNYLGERIEAAESTITQQAEEIELKVSESDVTGNYLISKINLTSTTAKIAAQNIDLQGAVTISSLDADAQGKIVIGSTSKNQYYLSNASDTLTGGSWSNSVKWVSGKYIWTRIATTKTFADNTTSTSYSDAIYDANLTAANTASVTANGALSKSESVYYRSTTSTTPTISASTSIGTAVNTSDAWEYVLPRPKSGCYFFTCEKYTDKAGNVSFSTVRQMANTTYTSLWCSANDATYIDGGHIYASSVTANQLASNSVTAAKIAADAVTAGKIATGAVTADKISVSDLAAVGAKIADFSISYSSISSGSMTVGSSTIYGAVLASNSPRLEFRQTYGGVSTYDKYVRVNGNGINFNMAKKGRTSWALSDTCFQIAYYENTSSGAMFPEFDLKLNGSYLWSIRPDDFEIFATSTLARGALKATGTKSRLINTENYGERLLYCYESPSPMFGDVGEAVIDDTGEAYIWIDPIFEQTVSLKQYQVFLQKYGAGDCYVSEKTGSYFVVEGTPGLSFGWELKAKQIDYDQLRLDRNDMEYTVPDEYLGTESANYVNQIFEGRYA